MKVKIERFKNKTISPISMPSQEFRLLDIGGLVRKLNFMITESEGRITLGEFTPKNPRKDSFIYRLADRKTTSVGKYSLTQYSASRGLWSLADVESPRSLGYIFVETGDADVSSDYSGIYETLRLRIKHPLELKSDLVIPNSSVKLDLEADDGLGGIKQYRRDHLRKAGIAWVKSDLSTILPTEWFLGGNLNHYELGRQQSS